MPEEPQSPTVDKEDFAELTEVYAMLKQDAKNMLLDLLEGVSLWRSTARMLFSFAIISFLLSLVFLWGSTSVGNARILSVELFLIAVFLWGVVVMTGLWGLRYRRKHEKLREKYAELYEAAKKLS